MPSPDPDSLDGWYLIEQMGHKRLAGYVRQVTLAGAGLLRVDVPSDPPVTQLIHPNTLYCLTPIDEALARAVAQRYAPEPVSRYELRQLTPPATVEATVQDHTWHDDDDGDPDDRPF